MKKEFVKQDNKKSRILFNLYAMLFSLFTIFVSLKYVSNIKSSDILNYSWYPIDYIRIFSYISIALFIIFTILFILQTIKNLNLTSALIIFILCQCTIFNFEVHSFFGSLGYGILFVSILVVLVFKFHPSGALKVIANIVLVINSALTGYFICVYFVEISYLNAIVIIPIMVLMVIAPVWLLSSSYKVIKTVENNVRVTEQSIQTPQPTVQKNVPVNDGVPEMIKEYKSLLDSGIITQEEFDAKKKELLGL